MALRTVWDPRIFEVLVSRQKTEVPLGIFVLSIRTAAVEGRVGQRMYQCRRSGADWQVHGMVVERAVVGIDDFARLWSCTIRVPAGTTLMAIACYRAPGIDEDVGEVERRGYLTPASST